MAKKSLLKFYYNGVLKLFPADNFIYEVSLYKIWKNRAECIETKLYTSNKILYVKDCTSIKVDDYTLIKFVSLLAAPLDYLRTNNFKLTTNEEIRLKRKPNTRKNK